MFDPTLLIGPPFTAAGSGREKDKQTPTKNEETVSEQVQGVAQQQGTPLFWLVYFSPTS